MRRILMFYGLIIFAVAITSYDDNNSENKQNEDEVENIIEENNED